MAVMIVSTEIINGEEWSGAYTKEGGKLWYLTLCEGREVARSMVYKVDSGSPYIRSFGKRFRCDASEVYKAMNEL